MKVRRIFCPILYNGLNEVSIFPSIQYNILKKNGLAALPLFVVLRLITEIEVFKVDFQCRKQ